LTLCVVAPVVVPVLLLLLLLVPVLRIGPVVTRIVARRVGGRP
jgi:hypothetical protein